MEATTNSISSKLVAFPKWSSELVGHFIGNVLPNAARVLRTSSSPLEGNDNSQKRVSFAGLWFSLAEKDVSDKFAIWSCWSWPNQVAYHLEGVVGAIRWQKSSLFDLSECAGPSCLFCGCLRNSSHDSDERGAKQDGGELHIDVLGVRINRLKNGWNPN